MRAIDVFLLANDVIQSLKKKQGGTLVAPIPVLIDEHVSGVIKIVEERAKVKVITECLPWPGETIQATLHQNKDSNESTIFYSADLNACWARFAICKEAIHILCDEEHRTRDPEALILGLVNGDNFGLTDDIHIEYLAEYGAAEMLIPSELVPDVYELDDQGLSVFEIALKYRVPQFVVAFRLSARGRKMYDAVKVALDRV